MSIRYQLLAAAALCGALGAAHAGTSIDERRPLNADARVSVNNTAGSIQVQAWDKNELYLSGELGDGGEKLELTGDAASLKIEVKLPKKSHNVEDTMLVLRVPAGARLNLQGVSSDIRVQNMRGALEVNSVSGDISLDVKSAEVSAQTVSGDVRLQAPSSQTRVSSVSGDVVVRGVQGELRGEAVSGSLQIDSGGPLSEVHLNSISGDVEMALTLTDNAKVAAETLSGDVRLHLPTAPSTQLTLKTFSGEVTSAYGSVPSEAKHFETTLGAGKGSISLSSFSGDVSVTRR